MASVEQGDLLKVEGIQMPVIVVSNNYFNQSGKAIVCPIMKKAAVGPLHIELKDSEVEGIVLCEQVRYLALTSFHIRIENFAVAPLSFQVRRFGYSATAPV